jgi:methylmalonyl-CoA/ethylmalonyl-CoA epimerase
MRFHHLGIFVKTIKDGNSFFKQSLKIKKQSHIIKDFTMGVIVQFLYDADGMCYEIVAPLGKNSPVDEILQKKKNILNHLAYKTKNFDLDILRLRSLNCLPISKIFKAKAFKGSKVIFFLNRLGYIIELIEMK